jgi:hypothetical protein
MATGQRLQAGVGFIAIWQGLPEFGGSENVCCGESNAKRPTWPAANPGTGFRPYPAECRKTS